MNFLCSKETLSSEHAAPQVPLIFIGFYTDAQTCCDTSSV